MPPISPPLSSPPLPLPLLSHTPSRAALPSLFLPQESAVTLNSPRSNGKRAHIESVIRQHADAHRLFKPLHIREVLLVDDDPNNFADASTQDSLQELTSPEGFRLFFQQSEACPAMVPESKGSGGGGSGGGDGGAAACLGRSRQGYCKTMLVDKSTGVTEEQLQYLVQQATQQATQQPADTPARTDTQGTATGHEHDACSKDAGAMSAPQEMGNAVTMVCPALSALTYAWATDQLHPAMVRARYSV